MTHPPDRILDESCRQAHAPPAFDVRRAEQPKQVEGGVNERGRRDVQLPQELDPGTPAFRQGHPRKHASDPIRIWRWPEGDGLRRRRAGAIPVRGDAERSGVRAHQHTTRCRHSRRAQRDGRSHGARRREYDVS
jgi:hypothetical protein